MADGISTLIWSLGRGFGACLSEGDFSGAGKIDFRKKSDAIKETLT